MRLEIQVRCWHNFVRIVIIITTTSSVLHSTKLAQLVNVFILKKEIYIENEVSSDYGNFVRIFITTSVTFNKLGSAKLAHQYPWQNFLRVN